MRLLAALLVAGSGCALPQEQGSERAAGGQAHAPVNVIVLFSDDAGYADFGFQPSVEADMAGLAGRFRPETAGESGNLRVEGAC